MTFIPGSWVDNIQIIKGAGSVINGYESIAGQINTELVKPILDTPIYLNIYMGVRMVVLNSITTSILKFQIIGIQDFTYMGMCEICKWTTMGMALWMYLQEAKST